MHTWNSFNDMYFKINQMNNNLSEHTSHTMRSGSKANVRGSGSGNFSCMSFFSNLQPMWENLMV